MTDPVRSGEVTRFEASPGTGRAKLGIVESPDSSRRVLAVLAYLQG